MLTETIAEKNQKSSKSLPVLHSKLRLQVICRPKVNGLYTYKVLPSLYS